MPIVGLKGQRVRLVPPDRTLHLENALIWLNDPEVTATLKLNLGVSRRQEDLFFEQIETKRDSDFVWAIVDETERHVGFIGLHGINWRNRWATGGLLIGERSAWGRGYASDAVRVRTRFAFGELGLHRIEGHTMNPAMKRVYEKCGYKHEGVARKKFWRDGRWHDAELFAILEEDWFESTALDRVDIVVPPR
jgi:RimJ/RimL family protein N-acetyltransferase